MPHTPGHTSAPYKVYGTNEPYNGMTVEIGGFMYSTVGGALEGDSMQLVANPQPNPVPDLPPNGTTRTRRNAGQVIPPNNTNQNQQNQLMGGGIGPGGVNPNQDQQNQLMGGGRGGQAGVNPNQDMDNLY